MVVLNKQEQDTLSKIKDPTQRKTFEALLLAAKAEAQQPKVVKTIKGGLSFYNGFSRYPTTLYKSQWEALLANVDMIRAQVSSLPDRKEE